LDRKLYGDLRDIISHRTDEGEVVAVTGDDTPPLLPDVISMPCPFLKNTPVKVPAPDVTNRSCLPFAFTN